MRLTVAINETALRKTRAGTDTAGRCRWKGERERASASADAEGFAIARDERVTRFDDPHYVVAHYRSSTLLVAIVSGAVSAASPFDVVAPTSVSAVCLTTGVAS